MISDKDNTVIDDSFFEQAGLSSLSSDSKRDLLNNILQELEFRVGEYIEKCATEAEVKEFDSFVENGDDERIEVWLQQHCPDYNDVVNKEIVKIKEQIIQQSSDIIAAYRKDRSD